MEMGPLKNWELPRATAGCDRSRIRGFFESSSVITDTAVVCAIGLGVRDFCDVFHRGDAAQDPLRKRLQNVLFVARQNLHTHAQIYVHSRARSQIHAEIDIHMHTRARRASCRASVPRRRFFQNGGQGHVAGTRDVDDGRPARGHRGRRRCDDGEGLGVLVPVRGEHRCAVAYGRAACAPGSASGRRR